MTRGSEADFRPFQLPQGLLPAFAGNKALQFCKKAEYSLRILLYFEPEECILLPIDRHVPGGGAGTEGLFLPQQPLVVRGRSGVEGLSQQILRN